jgi:hypothetical protein
MVRMRVVEAVLRGLAVLRSLVSPPVRSAAALQSEGKYMEQLLITSPTPGPAKEVSCAPISQPRDLALPLPRCRAVEHRSMTAIKQLLRNFVPARLLLRRRALLQLKRWELKRWEPELALVQLACEKSATAVDVGANLGVYTYFAAKYSARVYSIEPMPDVAARLRVSVPSNVTVLPLAARTRPVDRHSTYPGWGASPWLRGQRWRRRQIRASMRIPSR